MKSDARGRAWEAYFTTTARLSDRIESALKASSSISLPEYNVLLQVYRSGEAGIRPSILAQQVVFSPSRLTHTIKRLIERGLVTRSTCLGDGRGGLIHLTDEGEAVYRKSAEVQRGIIRTFALEGLTEDEVDVLSRVFTRISHRLDTAEA
ncbi:MarR family winged helix-turn-helix transcriptional regulator [Schaalia vaccimaxillae]|uniref:MarR family winged helix-turn-helix transcriptional regulator n=1 Tax=Schaalia vaccimaxillae TaxID=183916 RepID=UPI0003B63572|nr:MarR family transcriptional regulator [Schaalia vaccimaxillae]